MGLEALAAKWRVNPADATYDDAPTHEPMRQQVKPMQRRAPTAEQKRERRAISRGQVKTAIWDRDDPQAKHLLVAPDHPNSPTMCNRRGPQYQTVSDPAEVTCSDCLSEHEGSQPCDHPYCEGWPEGEHSKAEHIDPADRDPYSDQSMDAEKSLRETGLDEHPLAFLLEQNHREDGTNGPTKYSAYTQADFGRTVMDEFEKHHPSPAKSWNIADQSSRGDGSGDAGGTSVSQSMSDSGGTGSAGAGSGSTASRLTPFSVYHAMRKGAPFAGYDDFEDCTAENSDKDDPDAYCGEIKHRTEDSKKTSAKVDDPDHQWSAGEHAGYAACESCGEEHPAEYSHQETMWSGNGHQETGKPVFAVTCPKDGLTDYWTPEGLTRKATRNPMGVANSMGQILLKAGDQIRTPTGQSVTVKNVRRHETSRDHYYVDTDAGTSVVPWSTQFDITRGGQTQVLPGPGISGGNFGDMPNYSGNVEDTSHGGQHAQQNVSQPEDCPSCKTKKSMVRRGGKFQCMQCGFTQNPQGGGMNFSDATQQYLSSLNDPRSAIARRCAAVLAEPDPNQKESL